MSNINDLKAELKATIEEAKMIRSAYTAENRQPNDEEQSKFDACINKSEVLKADINKLERENKLNSLEEEVKNSAPVTKLHRHVETNSKTSESDFAYMINNVMSNAANSGSISDKARMLMERSGCQFNGKGMKIMTRANAMSQSATYGGEFIPESWNDTVESVLKYSAPIRNYARVLKHETGEPFNLPIIDATGVSMSVYTENTADTGQTTVGNVTFPTHERTLGEYYIGARVIVSRQAIRNSKYDFYGLIKEEGLRAAALNMESILMMGSGTNTGKGIMKWGADSGVRMPALSSTNSNLEADLKAMYLSIDRAYRNDPSCIWVMPDALWSDIMDLQDTSTRSKLVGSLTDGYTERLFGKPVIISNSLDDGADIGDLVCGFGKASSFYIRDIAGVDFFIDETTLRNSNQVAIQIGLWFDCNGSYNNACFKTAKISATGS